MFTVLKEMHPHVAPRAARDAVPIACAGCTVEFAWSLSRGNRVTCPHCGATEDVDLAPSPKIAEQIAEAQKGAHSDKLPGIG